MKIKDQIRLRREARGLSMKQLAQMLDVSEQAIRHWESGRSYPGKSKSRDIEQALEFKLDWNEGTGNDGNAAALVDAADMELLLVICKLPARAKNLIGEFARMQMDLVEGLRGHSVELPASVTGAQPAVAPPDDPPAPAKRPAAKKAVKA